MLKKIDIKGGRFSYGQRIALGKILSSDASEVEKFEQVIKCLYDKTISPRQYKKWLPLFNEIVEGLSFWCKQEAAMLDYKPTPEEIRAGIKELGAKVGEFGTIKALAKAYNTDPDDVLKWEYAKVFGILTTDLEEHKFRVKLNEVYEQKYK